MTNSKFLKKLYIKSLLPHEILELNKKESFTFDSKKERLHVKLLKSSTGLNVSEESFENYCNLCNLNNRDISLMFSSITNYNAEIESPFWITALENILSRVGNGVEINDEKAKKIPFYHLLFPFVDFFEYSLTLTLKPFNKTVINQLNSALYKELFKVSHLVLLEEFSEFLKENRSDDSERDKTEDDFYYKEYTQRILMNKYHTLFLKYPMLARKLATITYQYINFITILFKRLKEDKNEIEYYFKTSIGKISQIFLNAGDQHSGESTVIIEFENSYKIVYKPTSVDVTNAYNNFLGWVNESLGEKLIKFEVIDKGDYGWLEYVADLECNNGNDVKIYYERAGILTGIAYFFSTRDYHFENVIASGNSPVLIDHETVIGPKTKYRIKNDIKNYEHSVLESLLIPTDKTKDREICGFGSVIQKNKQTFISPKLININTDLMMKVPQLIVQNNDLKHIPHLNKIPHYIEDYKDEFKLGFSKLYNFILENKTFLLSDKSPIYNFENKKIRFLIRNTDVYAKLLMILSKPEYLKNNLLYGIKQEALARAYIVAENLNIALFKSEREQMTLGDIPAFYTNTLSDDLTLENGEKVDLFEMNAIDSLKNKIKFASIENHNEQLYLIEESLSLHVIST